FVLPYTVQYIGQNLIDRWHLSSNPRKELQVYGGDIRTPPAFEANLDAIAATAQQRGDRLGPMTFAYYLPSNYTEGAFRGRPSDYDRHVSRAAMWGEPANVARAIDLHNEAALRVAERRGLPLIDQRAGIPDGKRYFHDPCHLTDAGCARWVENVVEGLDWS